MTKQQCEWCVAPATSRYSVGRSYCRYACHWHRAKTEALVRIDRKRGRVEVAVDEMGFRP